MKPTNTLLSKRKNTRGSRKFYLMIKPLYTNNTVNTAGAKLSSTALARPRDLGIFVPEVD